MQYSILKLSNMNTQFSAQLQKFIPIIKKLAVSSFRPTDARTSTTYFLSIDGMVHSTDRNYSALVANLTEADFIGSFSKLTKGYAIAYIL